VEFKLDTVRPEQLAKEVVALANLKGGHILLGVADDKSIAGITRGNLSEWLADTVFTRYVHPVILPYYEEVHLDDGKVVAIITIGQEVSKPYVVWANDRETAYVRIGSISRQATREQLLMLGSASGFIHAEVMPVHRTSFDDLDRSRLENYLNDILNDPDTPETRDAWIARLQALGLMTEGPVGAAVCTIAGLVLFGIRPRQALKQSGLHLMFFNALDKIYQAQLDKILDAPLVGRFQVGKTGKILIDGGLIEKALDAMEPFVTREADTIDAHFRRDKHWLYPFEALRELLINALAHRDWTRFVDVEMVGYADRLEITSPGALPNAMTVEKNAGRPAFRPQPPHRRSAAGLRLCRCTGNGDSRQGGAGPHGDWGDLAGGGHRRFRENHRRQSPRSRRWDQGAARIGDGSDGSGGKRPATGRWRMRVLDHLQKAVRGAAIYNPEVQVAPACILWPDRERQWEAVMPVLQAELPELLILGDYAPERRVGPAIWLRGVMAGQVPEVALPRERTPIFYLPGVSRQDLRAVETCPEHLKPLAELQYRGVIWSQLNAKDWTILAFLKSDQGGLGLDVAQDKDAKNAMQLALYRLLDEDCSLLHGKRLDQDYFNTLLTGGDTLRDLLQWLDQGDAFQQARGTQAWQAFAAVCKSQLAFNPHTAGVLAAAARLASREGPWKAVWERYCEAPRRYPGIPARLRQCQPPPFDLLASAETVGGWPQWNDDQESTLAQALLALDKLPAHEARKRVVDLDKRHGQRRALVWAELDEAPLAQALQPLRLVAELTQSSPGAGDIADLQAAYVHQGWRVDDAVLTALAGITRPADLTAITAAVRALYLPWLEEAARYLQQQVSQAGYPGGTLTSHKPFAATPGECVLFVDGLRFDAAQRLAARLEAGGYQVQATPVWVALPSVTATGKAAVTPVRDLIGGDEASVDFEPCVAATGQTLRGGYHLKKLLTDRQWAVLDKFDQGSGQGNAWCEFGDIDTEGHQRGLKLARQLDGLLAEVAERIGALLAAGWRRVRVVTDHGWLLLPGKLPQVPLANDLVDTKWGRCAALKPGAATTERLYPWFWNPLQQFALADGISCYGQSPEYSHGGLSMQECLTLELQVTAGAGQISEPRVAFTDVVWKGLRCTVAVDGPFAHLSLDIRLAAGEPATTVVVGTKALKDNGTASVVVEDEDLQGRDAYLALLSPTGELVAQNPVIIGGEA
jgi:predicted HTH transcriptional regulator